MRSNLREFAIKKESNPGTAETVAEADVLVRSRAGDTINVSVDTFDTEEVQATGSKRPLVKTVKRFLAEISYILRSPGSLSTDPAAKTLLETAMLRPAEVTAFAIGAVTSGPFVHNETVTGGTSGATGRVIVGAANGDAVIRVVDITGTFQSAEVLTGGTSGATATTSDTGTASGMAFLPVDSRFSGSDTLHHATIRALIDGFAVDGRGCLSSLGIDFRVGQPAVCRHSFLGAYDAHADVALFGKTSYSEESNALARWLNTQMTLGSYSPESLVDMSLDLGIETRLLEDANDASADGVLYADYTRNGPTLSLDPKFALVADYDFLTALTAGTTFAVRWQLGSSAGLMWEFYAPEAQYQDIGVGDREGTVTAPLTLRLNGSDNGEFVILQR